MQWFKRVLLIVPIILIGFLSITYVRVADPFGWRGTVAADFRRLADADRIVLGSSDFDTTTTMDAVRILRVTNILQSLESGWDPQQFRPRRANQLHLSLYTGDRPLLSLAFGDCALIASADAPFYSRAISQAIARELMQALDANFVLCSGG